ncbi:MAG: hypothetical protein LC114_07550 [Bryobacterales bacterium]|nr:hypothetical protein [Bryobacterales bacterium]
MRFVREARILNAKSYFARKLLEGPRLSMLEVSNRLLRIALKWCWLVR